MFRRRLVPLLLRVERHLLELLRERLGASHRSVARGLRAHRARDDDGGTNLHRRADALDARDVDDANDAFDAIVRVVVLARR